MENALKNIWTFKNLKVVTFDVLVVALIYLVPTLSHVFALPIYFIEPMRLALILAIVHTSRKNAYLLAATLPIFSSLISIHPGIIKSMLITFELFLNAYLFYTFAKLLKNNFASMLLAIILSKLSYYIIKFGLIKTTLLNSTMISTPIILQIVTTLIFSVYAYLLLKKSMLTENNK